VPPPLQVPPSRARRQFAARLAQRRAEKQAAQEAADGDDEDDNDNENEDFSILSPNSESDVTKKSPLTGGEGGSGRFSRMFEGIEDSSDEDDELGAGIRGGKSKRDRERDKVLRDGRADEDVEVGVVDLNPDDEEAVGRLVV
jgi:hypothetical protein